MDSEERAQGRDRVRQLFLARLDEGGLKRPKGMTVDQHSAVRKRLTDHLAYMSEVNLITLAETVMDAATGPLKSTWPAEATVRNFAHHIQAPPDEESRLVMSWFASVEGPIAESGGYTVELLEHLRRFRRPPNDYDKARIRETARDNAREAELITERMGRGTASDLERDWLDHYQRQRAYCRDLIRRGEEKRAAA